MTDHPDLNVVIVAYGPPVLLARCLEALGDGLSVVIVDNSSNVEVRALASQWGCTYIDPGGNVGFAAGVNRALVALGSEHGDVLLLNPDAQVTGDVVRGLHTTLHSTGPDRVACVSPAITTDAGENERIEWAFPSPRRAWLEAFRLGSLRPQRGFLIGAVLLLRGEAIDEVGPFDERFFLYAEETDWQYRAARSGWSVLACPQFVASHTGAATSSDDRLRQALFHASAERYIRKWYGALGWQTFRAGVLVGAGVRSLVSPDRASHRDRFARYLRGPLRCAGMLSGVR